MQRTTHETKTLRALGLLWVGPALTVACVYTRTTSTRISDFSLTNPRSPFEASTAKPPKLSTSWAEPADRSLHYKPQTL